MDKVNSIDQMKKLVKEFCDERDWDQFHDAKELAIGISTEANELLQLFRFKNREEINLLFQNDANIEKIEDELSDVFYFVLRFSQMYNIDLSESLKHKLKKNVAKYPIEKSKGINKKYDEE